MTAAVQADSVWARARTVLLYRAQPPEFSAVGLTNGAWRVGKRVLFPRINDAKAGTLSLHEVTRWGQLQPGTFRLLEPMPDCPEVPAEEVDLAIVPGLAWDAKRHRLGRGGGFYDRLLPRVAAPAWGIGFDCQLVDEVPAEPHDQAMERVWTCKAQGLLAPV